VHLTEAFLYRY